MEMQQDTLELYAWHLTQLCDGHCKFGWGSNKLIH